ncbi:MAG: hypothetical protein GXY07_14375 [Candidatus Hydrogenedentes bacterium]|jgi:DNA-directed RNA polymerase subunit M/transcription elongation factor TFIIS|nr:hypothetical protein [Candidatus Hydrogenedentota bacterium]
MTQHKCPHCGAAPFVPKRQDGIQDRCDACNALISVPEPAVEETRLPDAKEEPSADKGEEAPTP